MPCFLYTPGGCSRLAPIFSQHPMTVPQFSLRSLLALLFASLLAAPFWASAATVPKGKLAVDVWYITTQVSATGQDLDGPMPAKSKICFAPEGVPDQTMCFQSDHPNVIEWTSTSIKFVPPSNIPPRGIVRLNLPDWDLVDKYFDLGTYKAHPHILKVMDQTTGEIASTFVGGHKYRVEGYRFGDTKGGIYFGFKQMDNPNITHWAYDAIEFTMPESMSGSTEMYVHNGAGKGIAWNPAAYLASQENVPTTPAPQPSTDTGAVQETPETPAPVSDGTFTDVTTDHPYAAAIKWAVEEGLVEGYDDGSFKPDAPVQRAEFLKIALAAKKEVDFGTYNILNPEELDEFSDVDFSTAWYAPYIHYALAQHMVEGYANGTFGPGKTVNNAEALKLLYRINRIPTVDPMGTQWYARYAEHALENKLFYFAEVNMAAPMTRKDVVWLVWQMNYYLTNNTQCIEQLNTPRA